MQIINFVIIRRASKLDKIIGGRAFYTVAGVWDCGEMRLPH